MRNATGLHILIKSRMGKNLSPLQGWDFARWCLLRQSLMRLFKVTGLNGFGRWSSAPNPMYLSLPSASSRAVVIITGMWPNGWSAFVCSSPWHPLITGSMISRRTD